MNREQYESYLESFNTKNYETVLDFWAARFSVVVQGEVLFDSPESLIKVYGFLHDHVNEEIFIQQFLSDDNYIFMEAIVRITAEKTITAESLEEEGIKGIMPIEAGVAIDIPQFIHYSLENGKFKKGVCLVSAPPTPVSQP